MQEDTPIAVRAEPSARPEHQVDSNAHQRSNFGASCRGWPDRETTIVAPAGRADGPQTLRDTISKLLFYHELPNICLNNFLSYRTVQRSSLHKNYRFCELERKGWQLDESAKCLILEGILPEIAMSIPASIIGALYEHLGGPKTLPRPIRSEADLARLAIQGLPLRAFEAIRTAGFSERELATIIPPRTLRHRIKKKEPLNAVETERAIRLLSIQLQAEMALEDKEKARVWLRKPIRVLDGMTPLEAAQTEHGAEVVREMLGALAWGAAA